MKRVMIIAQLLFSILIIFSGCGENALQHFQNAYSTLQQDNSIHYIETYSVSTGDESYRYSYDCIYSGKECMMIMDSGLDTEMIIIFRDSETYYKHTKQGQWNKTNSPLNLSYPWKDISLQSHFECNYTSYFENDYLILEFIFAEDYSIEYVIQNGSIIKISYKSKSEIVDSEPKAEILQITEYFLQEISDDNAENILDSYTTDLQS